MLLLFVLEADVGALRAGAVGKVVKAVFSQASPRAPIPTSHGGAGNIRRGTEGCRLVPSGYMAQNLEIHRIEAPRGAQ